jgi:hypothetical protein
VVKNNLLIQTISRSAHQKIVRKNRLSMSLYALAAVLSFVSVYISFTFFFIVPAMYFVPERIVHDN